MLTEKLVLTCAGDDEMGMEGRVHEEEGEEHAEGREDDEVGVETRE